MASPEVEAKQLPDEGLPTVLQIYQPFLHLEKVNIKSGEWKRTGTTLNTKAQCVAQSICDHWDKTHIPHEDLSGEKAIQVERWITSVRNLKKGRNVDIFEKFGKLFDIAKCKCSTPCTCALEDQVPPAWNQFLEYQRGTSVQRMRYYFSLM